MGDGRVSTRVATGLPRVVPPKDVAAQKRASPVTGAVWSEDRLTGIWYIVGFAIAAVSFTFLTFGAAWLLSHRNRGDVHKGLPYESGIDTLGDTHGRFGLSFYIYALLFVAFDIEVIFIYLRAVVFRDLLLGGLVSMLVFVGILLIGLAYAWRKGVLTWR